MKIIIIIRVFIPCTNEAGLRSLFSSISKSSSVDPAAHMRLPVMVQKHCIMLPALKGLAGDSWSL